MPNRSMMLPCELTTEDRLRVSEVLTNEIRSREQVEAAKKAAVKDFNIALKAARAKEHDLNESLFTGKELREVEVEERPDYAAGIVYIHRLDTGDCVQQRAIDPDERQVKLGVDPPKVLDGGKVDDAAKTDEQREAATPEEAEALREERLAQERAERISAVVTEQRERIVVLPKNGIRDGAVVEFYDATLQYGSKVFQAEGADTEDGARDGVVLQLVAHLEWQEAAAASEAEQKRQADEEVARLAAEQAADEASTPKRGFKRGLVAPERKKKNKRNVTMPDGREVDPEEEAAKLDAGEAPVPGDDGPVAVPAAEGNRDDDNLAF